MEKEKNTNQIKIIIGVALLVVAVCLSAYKLRNTSKTSKDNVVTAKGYTLNQEKLYSHLKKKYALNYILNEVDQKFLNEEIKPSKPERQFVDDYAKKYEDYIKGYALYGYQSANEMLKDKVGVESIEELKDFFRKEYKIKEYARKYIIKNLTDKEKKDYYENEIKGEIKVSHILIQSKAKSSSSEKEKEKAKKEAKEKAEKIIARLDKGEKFSDLAKQYSDDTTKDKGGDLGFISQKGMVKSFTDAAFKLKKGEYTKKPVESEYGYHIILKTDEKAKAKYKDVEEDIIEQLVKKKLTEDKKIMAKALIDLRKKYNFKLEDKDLAKEYKNIIKNINAK